MAAYLGLDRVELADTVEQVGGQRGRLLLVALEQLTAKMRPAGDFRHAVTGVDAAESGIGVGLEKPGEPGELALRVHAGAVGGKPIPDERWGSGSRRAIVDDIGP